MRDIPLVEVLTSRTGRAVLGYHIGGFRPGPRLLVAGHDPVASLVYDRLLALPTLGWMRGKLTLVRLNLMEQEGLAAHFGTTVPEHPDDILFLPYRLDEVHHPRATRMGYWSVLRSCAQLGMIDGRGIPYEAQNKGTHHAT